MKEVVALCVTLVLCTVLTVPAVAGEAKARSGEARTVTVEGKLMCAKCSLHKEGQTECQNVLVTERRGKEKTFYLTKNNVYEKFGEVCKGVKAVRVTGEVTRKDGHAWLAASEIEPVDDKG